VNTKKLHKQQIIAMESENCEVDACACFGAMADDEEEEEEGGGLVENSAAHDPDAMPNLLDEDLTRAPTMDPRNQSQERRRSCCCCSCWTTIAVIIHIIILAAAILGMIPIGVMTSVMRAFMSGVVTFIWLVYCCVSVTSNLVSFFIGPARKEKHSDGDDPPSRLSDLCNKMGCLCVGPPPPSACCWNKIPWSIAISLLLVLEGILLLTPVLASVSSFHSLDSDSNSGGIIFDEAKAVDPRPSPFSFGQYMLPGSFSQFGGYDNNAGRAKTFKYKDGCEPECELDIHIPKSNGESTPSSSSGYPVIFHIHGGGWDSGEKSTPLVPISYWLNRNYAFVSIQYRFPSQTPGGATVFEQLDDVQDAFDYITSIGAEEGLDTSRVLFFGDSAGGHLACTVAYRSGAPGIRGLVNLYGATEWEYYMDSGGGYLEGLFEKVLPSSATAKDDYRNVSCSTYATSASAPILTVHGTWDTLVPMAVSEHLHSVVTTLGVSNLLVEVPLAEHVLEAGFYSVGGQMTIFAMERFVAAQL